MQIANKTFHIVNLYCPNQSHARETFIHNTTNHILNKNYDVQKLIIGGDFNCINNPNDKLKYTQNVNNKMFDKMLSKLDVLDIWRSQHPQTKEFTYIDPSKRGFNSRIDNADIWVYNKESDYAGTLTRSQSSCDQY